MIYEKKTNLIGESIARATGGWFLDANKLVWKLKNNEWIGKRSVWTYDFRACWLEDTKESNVKSWWCGGKEADYSEIFKRKINQ